MSIPRVTQVVVDGARGRRRGRQGVDGGIPVGRTRYPGKQKPPATGPAPFCALEGSVPHCATPSRRTGERRAGCAKGRPHVVARPKTDVLPRTPTPAVPSPFSRASRRSASAPVCTSARPASAACTTWCGRSSTTPSTRRWPATATRSQVTLLADGGVRVEDNGRGIPVDMHPVEKRPTVEVVMTIAARRRQVRRQELRASPAVCTASASRSSTRCPRGSTSRSGATAPSGASSYDLRQARPAGEGRPDEEAGTAVTFWPDGEIFETTTYSFETIYRRLQEMAFLNRGLTIALRDERRGHSKAETGLGRRSRSPRRHRPGPRTRRRGHRGHLQVQGRHRRLRRAPQRQEVADPQVGDQFGAEGTARTTWRCRSRSRCSGTSRTRSRSTPSPTRSTRTRAARTRRASGRR